MKNMSLRPTTGGGMYLFLSLCLTIFSLSLSASAVLPPPEDCNNALVGKSVVVDQISSGLVGLFVGGNTLDNILDGDLENFAEFGGLNASVLGSSLISVKDVTTTYPAGRRAGFLIEDAGGLLSTGVLSGLVVRTYLNDVLQETATTGNGLLSVGLLGGSNGPQRLAFQTTLPFDEIELGQTGLLSLGGNIRVYYAFEEDPTCDADCTEEIIPANGYTPSIVAARSGSFGGICAFCSVGNRNQAIDNTLTNGATLDFGVSLGARLALAIDLGATLPESTQAGFVITRSGLLGLLDLSVLSGFTIQTYNNGVLVEQQALNGNLATVGLINGGNQLSLAITTTAAFDEIRLIADSGLIGIGTTITVNYGFVRRDSDGDGVVDCIDKCVGDDNLLNNAGLPLACNPECGVDAGADFAVCSVDNAAPTAQLVMAPAGVTYTYTPLMGNPAMTSVSGTGLVSGFTTAGVYAFAISDGTCSDTVAVNFSAGNSTLTCNDPLTGRDVIIDAAGAFNGICLLCSDGDAGNVIDTDLNNALVYTDLANVLSLQSLISIKDTTTVYPAGTRAGYVIEFPTGLLDLSVLNSLQIRTYLDDVLQETAISSGLLDVGLLGGSGTRQRVAFTTTAPFDEVELLSTSGVSLLGSIAIYYAFTEDAGCDFTGNPINDPAAICIEPLTVASDYCASINYEETGFGGLACVNCNIGPLSALIDSDPATGTTITQTVGLATTSTIAVRTATTVSAGYEAGFVISNSSALLDVGLLSNITLSTYLDGVQQEALALSNSLVSISLLGGGSNTALVGFRASQPFNEVRIRINGLVGADLLGGGLTVFYAYVRLDSDGDGVPDCLDRCCAGDDSIDSDGNGVPDGCDALPVAMDDSYVLEVDMPSNLPVLTNDDFGDDGPGDEPIAIITLPENGTATVNDGGTPTDPSDDSIDYTPNSTFVGMDSLFYLITDGNGSTDTAIVRLLIQPAANMSPVATDDAETTDEDTELMATVITNDTDVDGPDTLITLVTDVTNGTLVLDTDGSYTYTPDADFTGTDNFTYSYCDGGTPELCDTAMVTITVNAVNDAPDAMDDVASTDEDTELMATVITNDTDVDGPDTLITLVTDVTNGTLVLDTDGSYTYTPDADFTGTDNFTYSYCDGGSPELCDTAMVTITVNAVNDAPDAMDDVASTDEDTELMATVITNDTDVDGPDTLITLVTDVTNGTLVLNTDGSYTYTPDADFTGTDNFTYSYCDGGTPELCDTAMVTITVNAVNDAPDAMDDAETTDEDTELMATVITNDTDVDGPDTLITLVTDVTNGTLVLNTDGSYTYTPDADFTGTDNFTYSYCDGGTPELCDTAMVTITVNAVNDAPDAMDDAATTDEDTELMATVITNDTDVDGPDTLITLVTDVTNGTLVLNTDGSYTYTPDADFTGTDNFTYSYCDGGTPELCDTAMVTITVDPVNDDPVITDTDGTPMDTLFVQVPEDGSDTTCVSVMDVDGDVTTCTLIDPVSGTAMLLDDTCVVYNPLPEYSGPDTLSKIACDGSGACDTIVIVYEVLPVNDAPDAMDDVASTDEDTDLMATVITNDTDVDGPDTLITLVTDVTNGTLVLDTDGSYTYTPDADFNGTDSFTYSYCDGGTPEACDTAMVTITVDPVNDDPVITDTDGTPMDTLFVQVPEDGSDTTCVSVMDVDGDVTTCTLIDPVSGTAMLLDDTCVVYNPLPEYSGPDTLSKIACDGSGACDTIVIVYEVLPVNDAPDAMDDVASTDEDTDLMATVITNDTDVDGPDTLITLVTDVTNGTLVLNTDGSYTYTPDADFTGTDNFTYSYCDGGTPELCDTAMVTITVNAVNDAPDAMDDVASHG